jgi:NADP-dependent alcohol dehydrogenase
MNNFILHTPTKVLFGKGQVAQLRGQIPSDARILVTYGGGSVVRSGLLDQIRSELAGLTLFEFGGIEPNPTYETLMGAVELARAEKVDFLLAVGGGSSTSGEKRSPSYFLLQAADLQSMFLGCGACLSSSSPSQ